MMNPPCIVSQHAWRPNMVCDPQLSGSGGGLSQWTGPCYRPWWILLAMGAAYVMGRSLKGKRSGVRVSRVRRK